MAGDAGLATGSWGALLQRVPLAFFAWDPVDFRLLAWNGAAERMFAAAGRKVCGARLPELLGSRADEERLREIVSGVRATGVAECELGVERGRQRGVCTTRWYSCGVTDEGGGLRAVLSVVETVPAHSRKRFDVLRQILILVAASWSSVDELCRETVKVLLPGRGRSAIFGVRIRLEDRDFSSKGFRAGKAVQSAEVMVGEEKVGVVEFHYPGDMPGGPAGILARDHRELLEVVAGAIAGGIERLRARERAEKGKRLHRCVGELRQLMVTEREPRKLLDRACAALGEALNCRVTWVEEPGGVSGSAAALPLAWQGEVLGVLRVHAPGRGAFGPEELELLRDVASDLGFALGSIRMEKKYRHLFDQASEAVFVHDMQGRITEVNQEACDRLGYSQRELLGMRMDDIELPGGGQGVADRIRGLRGEGRIVCESVHVAADGRRMPVEMSSSLVEIGGEQYVLNFVRDMRERKLSEQALRESEREALALASFREHVMRTATVWINLLDTRGNVTLWNEEAERISGYSAAEVVDHARIWEWLYPDEEYRLAIMERAKRIIAGLEEDRDFETRITCKDGSTRIIAWNSKQLADALGNVVGSIAIGRDVSGYRLTQEKLSQSFLSMAATTVEVFNLRDPYTAEHSRGVAHLAREVGRLLGASPDQLNALWVGGILHDLGKLGVPEMLLVKPGRLSEAERALIKEHTRLGYEVLRTAGFPWPVAEVALQHHERIDGSGCPEGLSGDEIVWEAKVIGICDVADAMLSRRPYRDARSVAETVREIERNRGTRYDPAAADALLRLIRTGGHRPG